MPPFLLIGDDDMSSKQDVVAARTAADLERKYNIKKSFAEAIGIANDAREKADAVYSELKSEITEQATSIRRDTEKIVTQATKTTTDSIEALTRTVEQKISADDLSIAVKAELESGVDGIGIKETDFVFNAQGLSISKAGEQMKNLLDTSGMYVSRGEEYILVANDKGVEALNLHAKNFLKIGSGDGRCRFEDYGAAGIGCFWTGG